MEKTKKKSDKMIPFSAKKLLDLMKSKGVTISDMSRKYRISRGTLHSILDSNQISKRDAAVFAYAFRLPPGFFDLDDDSLIFNSNEKMNDLNFKAQYVKLLSYYTDYKLKGLDYLHFLRDYFEALIAVVRNAENEIIIFDYLANNFQLLQKLPGKADDRQIVYETFHELYKNYMMEINLKIKERISKGIPFNYIRVCQIPLDNKEPKIDPKRFVLQKLYRNVVAHYEYLYKALNFTSFKLYVLEKPIRPYSFIMSDWMITSEYDRIDRDGSFYPDLIFLNGGSTGLKMIHTYKIQLEQILINAQEIRREDANKLLPEIYEFLKTESEESSKELHKYLADYHKVLRPESTEDLFEIKTKCDDDFIEAKHAKAKLDHFNSEPSVLEEYFNKEL